MFDKAIELSGYLDFTACRILPIDDETAVQEAYGLSPSSVSAATEAHNNVAIVLERAHSAVSKPMPSRKATCGITASTPRSLEDQRHADNDFNDVLVGIDFTSAFGHAYLAKRPSSLSPASSLGVGVIAKGDSWCLACAAGMTPTQVG